MKKGVARGIRIVVSLAIIALLVKFARGVDWGRAWSAMTSASRPLLALALVVNILSLLARGVRWWILLRAAGNVSLGTALRATVAGAGLNNVLVANGGEAARVVFVTRSSGLPSSTVIATAALDRLFDPIGFVALLAIGTTLFDLPPDLARMRWPAVAVLVIAIVAIVWLARSSRTAEQEHVPERRAVPRGWRAKSRRWLADLAGGMRDLATGPRIIGVVLLTVAAWLLQLWTFDLAARAAHVHLPLAGSLAALLAINVALIIRATPGNVGFFQFAYALTTAPFGVSNADAVGVSVLIQALQIIPVTLLGVALAPEFLFKRKTKPPVTSES